VTIPPGKVEGTHQHIGSEELYYITEGSGLAYMRVGDDPKTDAFPTVEREVFGIGPRQFKQLPVSAGSVIFTKSGGMHGIRNPGSVPLKFIAFLYHQ
jgi:mannose-6-phosphate isomerase-like protein (cupin superfamily)